jgi:predicted lipid carrier protein YhbT
MADPTVALFDRLAQRGRDTLLEKYTGTLRFDLTHGKQTLYWLLTIRKGKLAVSREHLPADCIVQADQAVFDGIALGELNPMAAYLRGLLGVQGDLELLTAFRQLLPASARTGADLPTAGYARRQP